MNDEPEELNDADTEAGFDENPLAILKAQAEQLDYPTLRAAQNYLSQLLQQREKDARKQALQEMRAVAEQYGLSLKEIVQGQGSTTSAKTGSTKSKIPPKYRHPEDTAKTWAGRGRKPNWVQAWEEAGGDLETLRIPEAQRSEA